MARFIRALNSVGVDRFRAYLERAQGGAVAEPPVELLDDANFTNELTVEVPIERRRFATRFAMGEFLYNVLQGFRPDEVDRNVGLWAWLSLFFFDGVCPASKDGTRRPGQDYRHIPDLGFRNRNRHLLLGPYQVYRRHGPYSILLLSGLPNSESAIYHEIVSRQDLIANKGVIEATLLLYMDKKRGAPKPGCQDPKAPPGSVRRFVRVLQQLDINYDVYGMSGSDIIGLLPSEFDVWASRGQTSLEL